MPTTVSLLNMKGGVGKTTLAFNFAWYAAWKANMRVLAIDLDPQANLSQYFMGAQTYLNHISNDENGSIVDIFEQFTAPRRLHGSPAVLQPSRIIVNLQRWDDGSLLDLIVSRLELSISLRNPTEKAHLLANFVASVSSNYDLIIIDCPPTDSILTTAAYRCSRYLVVPIRPEFLATIGLPLLARSLEEYKISHSSQAIDIAGIVFNGKRRSNPSPEQMQSDDTVRKLATKNSWPVFENEAYYSDSYQSGSRAANPIFLTDYARQYVQDEFLDVGKEFLSKVGLK